MERTKRGERFAVEIIGSVQKGGDTRNSRKFEKNQQTDSDTLDSGRSNYTINRIDDKQQTNRQTRQQTRQDYTHRIKIIIIKYTVKIKGNTFKTRIQSKGTEGVQYKKINLDSKNRIHKEGCDQLLSVTKRVKGPFPPTTCPLAVITK